MPKEMGRNCKFFTQHYILDKGNFKWINAGHCMKLKLRNKQASALQSLIKHPVSQTPGAEGIIQSCSRGEQDCHLTDSHIQRIQPEAAANIHT